MNDTWQALLYVPAMLWLIVWDEWKDWWRESE